MINKFEDLLNQLANGEIGTIEVSHEEFFVFWDAWNKREDRKFFRGNAQLGGHITYVYDTTVV
ncbi:hypothetical protein [Vagococcus allomyrinae]|uniref:hypothetical protein n=1 Tax=Vagococcus allomyrinae TaxID=2794353 RepID=UPI001FD73147|nr:hypothetical protein [Vagococcus allomyrinae]